MQAKYRLKKNYQYVYVYKHAQSFSDRNFVVLYCSSKQKQSKVGFSVGKKTGKAVCRNKLRRQMKSVVASFAEKLVPNKNIVVLPRKSGPYQFSVIKKSLNEIFSKAGLLQ